MAKPTIARTEFASALNQVAHERNLDPQVVVDAIHQAILAAFKKDHPDSFKEDYVYEIDLDPASREAQKSNIVAECEKRLSTLINGTILRVLGGDVIVEIDTGKHGRIEAVMPRDQQVHSEDYHPNQRLTFLLHSIRDSARGREVVVSRADTGLIRELFRREVPEINSGSVEVKAISRDPGSRTKIAVYSHQSGVDPVGSCVGQKGVRVQAVISELNGEKIDIIQYSEDLEKFVGSALAPASNLSVKIDSKKQIAKVTAPEDQLSLAIGREGQNAKLAGKLVNLHIDITGPSEKGTSERKEDTVTD